MSRLLTTAILVASSMAAPAFAHGLRLEVRAEGACLIGHVAYSDGWPGAQEVVRVADTAGASVPERTATADDQGRFAVSVVPGRTYRVSVSGDEEHRVERELSIAAVEPSERAACRVSEKN